MAYRVKMPVYRSSGWEDVQGYEDLRLLWTSLRSIAQGKRKPLADGVQEKILLGLKRTVNESKSQRARVVAAGIILALADGDYTRDVYRSSKNTRGR